MKKLIFAFALFIAVQSKAQSIYTDESTLIQQLFGKTKKELVRTNLEIDENNSTDFWKLFDEYELERESIIKNKMVLLYRYANNYSNLTDEKAESIAKATLKNNIALEAISSKYYDRFSKLIGNVNASKFIQLESYIQNKIKSILQNDIPFISYIERSKKQD